mmetsp:Transcript_156616/g.276614  ORF Transcript_156616/g.276614 Transcript_156616/m.276614 type:complete len:210 (-) Transcript_156616:276-905(-)
MKHFEPCPQNPRTRPSRQGSPWTYRAGLLASWTLAESWSSLQSRSEGYRSPRRRRRPRPRPPNLIQPPRRSDVDEGQGHLPATPRSPMLHQKSGKETRRLPEDQEAPPLRSPDSLQRPLGATKLHFCWEKMWMMMRPAERRVRRHSSKTQALEAATAAPPSRRHEQRRSQCRRSAVYVSLNQSCERARRWHVPWRTPTLLNLQFQSLTG